MPKITTPGNPFHMVGLYAPVCHQIPPSEHYSNFTQEVVQREKEKKKCHSKKRKLEIKKNILYYQPKIMEDLELKLANSPHEKFIKDERHREKVIHLISTLYIKPIIDKRYQRSDYIYLSQKGFLAPMYGEHFYKDIIRALCNASVIEVENSYVVGEFPMAYRLSEKYVGYSFERHFLSRSSSLSKKIDAHREEQKKTSLHGRKGKNNQLYAKLEKELEGVSIDFEAAKAHILEKMIGYLEGPSTVEIKRRSPFRKGEWRGFCKPPTEEECQMLLQRCNEITGLPIVLSDELTPKTLKRIVDIYESEMIAVQMIHDRQFIFEIDQTSGRVHTNLTNLSSDLRKFIKLRGEKIIGTDLKNSQPLFLGLLLLDRYGRRGGMPDDVKEYIQLCLDGVIYDVLMEQSGIKYPTDKELSIMEEKEKHDYAKIRKGFKQSVFEKIFFGNVPKNVEPRFKSAKAFRERFPTVWDVIIEIKSNKKDYGENAHAQLAIKLQFKEQDIMILQAAKECLRKDIPVLTLHDALYTTEEHIHEVCVVILNCFVKNYGEEVVPKLTAA